VAIPAPRQGAAALVTGASSGIGLELARGLATRGHDLVLTARRRELLEDVAGELTREHRVRVEVCPADLSEPSERGRLAQEIETRGLAIDVLVLCAGFGMGGPFVEQNRDRLTLMMRTNIESTVTLAHAFTPGMAARSSGAVLVVSSIAGNQPMPNFGVYAATKAAVTSFGEMLSAELAASGVTVTVLVPGAVRTDFASVAQMTSQERRTPAPLWIDADACARAGLDGLERGRRKVVPRTAVRLMHFAGSHTPRGVWLRTVRRLLTP
jgi:uncharacterized protein